MGVKIVLFVSGVIATLFVEFVLLAIAAWRRMDKK